MGESPLYTTFNHDYYVNYALKGEKVGVLLDSPAHQFVVLHKGTVVRRLDMRGRVGHEMPFSHYLTLMLAEARTLREA